MDQVVDEQRRQIDDAAANEIEVRAFEGSAGHQPIAKAQHDAVIVARIRVGKRRQLRLVDRLARLGEQRVVQGDLGRAGLVGRKHLRPYQIGAQEIVGHREVAAVVSAQQAKARGAPEIAMRGQSPPI